MNNGAFGEGFPYSNFHDLNMDWIIKIAKDFLDQYTHIQDVIDQGLNDLEEKKETLEGLLQAWYDTHSEDIANQLADALEDLGTAVTNAINSFNTAAEEKAQQTLESIPDDYTTLGTNVTKIMHSQENNNLQYLATNTGSYVKADGTIDTNPYLRVSNYIAIPSDATAIYGYVLRDHSTAFNPFGCVYDENKNFLYALGTANHTNGYKTWILTPNAKYIRFNQSVSSTDDNYFMMRFIFLSYDNTDYVGYDSFSATSSVRFSNIGVVPITQGETYKIIAHGIQTEDRYRFFVYNSETESIVPTNYVDLTKFNDSIDITAEATGFLRMYNVENSTSVTANIDIYRYTKTELETTPHIYYVSKEVSLKEATCFKSLTDCLLHLKDDTREKIIYIEGGDYDIVQEYIDANVPVYTGDNPTSQYYDYCVWIPRNTHIIGRGLVRLLWMPQAGDITLNQSKTVSPLNVAESCTIENIEVHCKNGRYCLHNDGLNKFDFIGAKQVYKNVKFVKYAPDTDPVSGQEYGFYQTIGFGISARMCYEFDGCEFINENVSNAFYGHARSTVGIYNIDMIDSGNIYLKNCLIESPYLHCVRLDNEATNTLHIKTYFENCYLSGDIRINMSGEYLNAFDVLLLRCNTDATVTGNTTINRYEPRIKT